MEKDISVQFGDSTRREDTRRTEKKLKDMRKKEVLSKIEQLKEAKVLWFMTKKKKGKAKLQDV